MVNQEEALLILEYIDKTCPNLSKSPVAFMEKLIWDYFMGKIDTIPFLKGFLDENRNAKFIICHMPKEDREQNMKFFKNEFTLADRFNDGILSLMRVDDEIVMNLLKDITINFKEENQN